MAKEGLSCIIDSSALKNMIEGNKAEAGDDLVKMMKEYKEKGLKLNPSTTTAQLNRAIFLVNPKTPMKNLQKILSFITLMPSNTDYKSGEACHNEMVTLINLIGEFNKLREAQKK